MCISRYIKYFTPISQSVGAISHRDYFKYAITNDLCHKDILFQVSHYQQFISQRYIISSIALPGVRCSSVVRAFAHRAMGRRIDPS